MKTNTIKIIWVAALFFLTASITAQTEQGEELVVPLSKPESSGKLEMRLLNGSINVEAHNGKDVVIVSKPRKKTAKRKTKDGLRRISNNSSEFTVEEYNNKVVIRSKGGNSTTDFYLKVPTNFSLDLRTTNNGDIVVKEVNGEMEVSNTNGAITLTNISGSAIADALNKDIVVSFKKVTQNAAMAFTSLNGNLDITFPKDFKADFKARTDNGEIYTDFEMTPTKGSRYDKKTSNGIYKVNVEKWVAGKINGGGSEILFKTLNGDILIRKEE